jgi:hypothetical protein
MTLIAILVIVSSLLLTGPFIRLCKRPLRTEIGEVLMKIALGLALLRLSFGSIGER